MHTQMFGADDFGDLTGNNTITANSMLWGDQSPTIYPSSIIVTPEAPVIAPTLTGYAYYKVG